MTKSEVVTVSFPHLYHFVTALFQSAGLNSTAAKMTASAICSSTLRGVDSHGIRLIPHYVTAIQLGRIVAAAEFVRTDTGACTAILDANHGMAHAALHEAMEIALEKSAVSGAAFVAVRNSNHCGAMAPFALRACESNMLGFAFTNATAKLKTFGAKETFFGINPICMAAPMDGEDPFCFDAAPTVMSNNKVKMFAKAGQDLPPNTAADSDGETTVDPNLARMLLPLGGDIAGYKGFGWAMMVDILCSLLSDMPNGKNVSTMYESDGGCLQEKRYLGQFIGAIDISRFIDVDTFRKRLAETANTIRCESKVNPYGKAMVPGDPEKVVAKFRTANGIPIAVELVEELNACASNYNIAELKPI